MIGHTTVLITGLRGNGKTLRAVSLMKQEIAEGRPTFASNFKGLRVPGVQLLEDPREWETLPTGSILFVDEAQRYWRARRSGEPPAEVQAMETQRHVGITIVLLTQQPTYLDKHIRGLVDKHYHLIRRAGLKGSQVYEWERCRDDPLENASADAAEKSVFVFDSKDFADYDSAEVHTIKAKLPARAKMIAVAVLLVAGMFWWALGRFDRTPADPVADDGVPAAGGTPTPRGDDVSRRVRGLHYDSAESYLASLTPRVHEVIWSAPAFDGREVVSDPHVYCMASGHDGSDGCSCMTEQATRYDMDLDKCLTLARHGEPYNPFKPPEGGRSQRRVRGDGEPSPSAMAAPAAAPVGAEPAGVEQVARYGGFRPNG